MTYYASGRTLNLTHSLKSPVYSCVYADPILGFICMSLGCISNGTFKFMKVSFGGHFVRAKYRISLWFDVGMYKIKSAVHWFICVVITRPISINNWHIAT